MQKKKQKKKNHLNFDVLIPTSQMTFGKFLTSLSSYFLNLENGY